MKFVKSLVGFFTRKTTPQDRFLASVSNGKELKSRMGTLDREGSRSFGYTR